THYLFLLTPHPPTPPLFPYTTLFRSRRALFGTISETYRTCGTPGCRCHRKGPKHGPHLYVSYQGQKGKTTGYYVPKVIQAEVRRSEEHTSELQSLAYLVCRLLLEKKN